MNVLKLDFPETKLCLMQHYANMFQRVAMSIQTINKANKSVSSYHCAYSGTSIWAAEYQMLLSLFFMQTPIFTYHKSKILPVLSVFNVNISLGMQRQHNEQIFTRSLAAKGGVRIFLVGRPWLAIK